MIRASLVVGSLALSGCVTHSLGLAAGERLRPSSPAAVELFEGDPSRPHEIIGTVHAHCRTHWIAAAFNCREASLREALRIRAGELGADAVVGIRSSGFWQLEWSDFHARGKAVRWTAASQPPRPHLP